MSRFKFINLIDKLFVTFGIFLLVFAWLNFYFRNLWLSFFVGILISFSLVYLIGFVLGKKNKKLALSKAENEEMEKLFYAFRLSTKQEKLKILKSLIKKELETYKKDIKPQDFETVVEQKAPTENEYEKQNNVELKSGMLTYTMFNKTHLVILATNYEAITQSELMNILEGLNKIEVDVIDIVCNETKNVNAQIFTDKQINFIDKHTLYTLCKKHNICLDTKNIKLDAATPKFINVIKAMFAPNKARGYLLSGLIILFSSLILPYHIYYLVFGSTLIMFALACKLMKYVKTNP